MNKTQTWTKVVELLQTEAILNDTKLYKDLELLLAPKKASAEFPPILNSDGFVEQVYCNWHKKYEFVKEFAKVAKAKSGYAHECKVAVIEWQKYAKAIKQIEKDIANLINELLDENITTAEAKECKLEAEAEIKILRENREAKINFDD